MNRLNVEQRLIDYIQLLKSVKHRCSVAEMLKCDEHRLVAEGILVRWQGGCSANSMRAALAVELRLLVASGFGGRVGEEIGAAFSQIRWAMGFR